MEEATDIGGSEALGGGGGGEPPLSEQQAPFVFGDPTHYTGMPERRQWQCSTPASPLPSPPRPVYLPAATGPSPTQGHVFYYPGFSIGSRTSTASRQGRRQGRRRAPSFVYPSPPRPNEFVYPPTGSSPTRGRAAKRGRVPASSKAIQGLREVTATATANESDDCCAICLQGFDSHPDPAETTPRRLRAMPCSHTFHQDCIFEWLRRNAVCPLCGHQLPTEEDEEQEQWRSPSYFRGTTATVPWWTTNSSHYNLAAPS